MLVLRCCGCVCCNVSFGSKVRTQNLWVRCPWVVLCCFIVRSRLLVYSAGSGVNRVQVVLSGFSKRLFCFVQKLCVSMVVCISWLHSYLCVWE